MGRTCMHALATHPLTPLPASGRGNSPRLCQERRDQDSAARARGQAFALLCGSDGGMVELVADLIKEGADVNEKNHVSLNRVLSASA